MQKFNPQQLEAIHHFEGPLLVLAGAGTGKTGVVTRRIVRLIEQGIPPYRILGVTFTNKAADEMKERVQHLTEHQVLICTFHSLGARILRESIHHLGYANDFTIYDEDDASTALKGCIEELSIEANKEKLSEWRDQISRMKDRLEPPQTTDRLYQAYQKRLKASQAVDFDDLLFLPVQLFQQHPDVLKHYQERWPFLLVDEYQDTNHAQYQLIKLLAGERQNVFVVGDPDQSIYSWRGADVSNILQFDRDFTNAKVIRLEQNYRSSETILKAANGLISRNLSRYEKNLWSDRGEGEKVTLYEAKSDRDEAAFIAEAIEKHRRLGISYNDMAVFYRTNAQSRSFEDCLMYFGIPYVLVGSVSFYLRREIKDILALLRMIHSGSDVIAFNRTLALLKKGFGATTLEKIRDAAEKNQQPIFAFCRNPEGLKLSKKQQQALQEYVALIVELKAESGRGLLSELITYVIQKVDYFSLLQEDRETLINRKENLNELVAKAAEWEVKYLKPSLADFLAEMTLKASFDDVDSKKEHVYLMTAHNAKGLEFEVVFLAGLEEELFPHSSAMKDPEGLEEERRLCYVGMTRAKSKLYITHACYRYVWGHLRKMWQSRFLEEIPVDYVQFESRDGV